MEVRLENVEKKFGSVYAVRQLNLHIRSGEMVALLGPSGCGKTTTLFMLAGIYRPTSGVIRFGEKIVNHLRPQERKIGMVFQSYALYPHMTVFENIAFPLTIKKLPSSEIKSRVLKVAEMVQIQSLLDRKPGQLSGGQQQRVSLARALVKEPEILLLDEPLSNLDAALRMQMRVEIHKIQRELGITAIFVTHDQTEAMTLADRIALMRDGSLIAYGKPMELYEKPQDKFVAEFLGSPPINLIPVDVREGRVISQWDGKPIATLSATHTWETSLRLGIRPEHLFITSPSEGDLKGKVMLIEKLGHETIYTITCGPHMLRVRSREDDSANEGDWVGIRVRWDKAHWFAHDGKRIKIPPVQESVMSHEQKGTVAQ